MPFILVILAVVDVHVLAHNAVGGWIWPLDVVVLLAVHFGRGSFVSTEPLWQQRFLQEARKRAASPGRTPDEPSPDGEGLLLFANSSPSPRRLVNLPVALAIVHIAVSLAFEVETRWLPLLPLAVLTVYIVTFAMRPGNPVAWLFTVFSRGHTLQDASPGLQVSIAVVSLLQALISILLAFELFAGWTAYWVNLGVAGFEPTGSGPVTLWAVEKSYLWNALDMVPLLDINHVLRFAEPPGPADWKAGFVLVLFRAIVLVPIAGIFLIAARAAIDGISKRSFAEDTPSKREVVRIVDDIAAGRIDIGTAVNKRGAADDAVPRPRWQGHSMEGTSD